MVIDDEPMMLSCVRRSLWRHEVLTCSSASEALDILAKDGDIDIVLCDVNMPEMTGPAFLERLQAVAPQMATRVVLLTGGSSPCGGVPVLAKPFELLELQSLVESYRRLH